MALMLAALALQPIKIDPRYLNAIPMPSINSASPPILRPDYLSTDFHRLRMILSVVFHSRLLKDGCNLFDEVGIGYKKK